MADQPSDFADPRDRRILGALGLLAGISIIAHLIVVGYLPSPAPADLVSSYKANTGITVALILSAVVFSIFLVLFLTGTALWLKRDSPLLALPAATAMVLGVVLITLSVVISNGALDAASASSNDLGSSYQASATFEADFWANMMSWVANFGTLMLGAGMVLSGWIPWKGKEIPKVLLLILMVGGLVGILGVLGGSDFLAGVPFFALAIWTLGVGTILLRRGPSAPAPVPG